MINESSQKFYSTLQTFALIISPSPHFKVKESGPITVFENKKPDSEKILTSLTYYSTDSSDYYKDSIIPEIIEVDFLKRPVLLLEAQQSLLMAKFADADIFAIDEFKQAQSLISQTETFSQTKENENLFEIAGRKAIEMANYAEEKAKENKITADRRNEINTCNTHIKDLEIKLDKKDADLTKEQLSKANLLEEKERALKETFQKIFKAEKEILLLEKQLEKQNADQAQILKDREIEAHQFKINFVKSIVASLLKQLGNVEENTPANEKALILRLNDNIWEAQQPNKLKSSFLAEVQRFFQSCERLTNVRIHIQIVALEENTSEKVNIVTQTKSEILRDTFSSFIANNTFIEVRPYDLSQFSSTSESSNNPNTEIIFLFELI